MTARSLTEKLAQNPRTAGAPRCCIELEASGICDQIQSSEAAGLPVEDSQLDELLERGLLRLENDARLAAIAGNPGEEAE